MNKVNEDALLCYLTEIALGSLNSFKNQGSWEKAWKSISNTASESGKSNGIHEVSNKRFLKGINGQDILFYKIKILMVLFNHTLYNQ